MRWFRKRESDRDFVKSLVNQMIKNEGVIVGMACDDLVFINKAHRPVTPRMLQALDELERALREWLLWDPDQSEKIDIDLNETD